jgi:hypothetical protein
LFNVDVENMDVNSYDMIMDTTPGSATSDLAVSTVEPQVFRRVLGQFLTGVAVISAMDGQSQSG